MDPLCIGSTIKKGVTYRVKKKSEIYKVKFFAHYLI